VNDHRALIGSVVQELKEFVGPKFFDVETTAQEAVTFAGPDGHAQHALWVLLVDDEQLQLEPRCIRYGEIAVGKPRRHEWFHVITAGCAGCGDHDFMRVSAPRKLTEVIWRHVVTVSVP